MPHPTLTHAALLTCAFGLPLAFASEPPRAERRPEVDPEASLSELRRELAALGPTPSERLAATEASPKERAAMRENLASWNRHQMTGDHGFIRAEARRELVSRHGLACLPLLLEALEAESYWERREAAKACAQLMAQEGEAARWLLFHHEVPRRILALVGSGPRYERYGLLLDLRAALRAVTGLEPLAEVELPQREWWTEAQLAHLEGRVRRAWRKAWSEERERWRSEQASRAAYRQALEEVIASREERR